VTEAWPPNVERARARLAPGGIEIHRTEENGLLPAPDETFELVTSRHPVRPNWPEIRRALAPGGPYFGQHVGPESTFELIEYFLGPYPPSVEVETHTGKPAMPSRLG
jgi:hypothetical protein